MTKYDGDSSGSVASCSPSSNACSSSTRSTRCPG
jgi:hypothetical protein